MISDGVFDTEFVGTLSSIFFTSYAIGQLINGLIENRVKAKYMMTFGLLLSGAANYVFSLVPGTLPYSYAAYALCGFFISMIYAPMTKLVADSMEPIYV